LVTGSQLPRKVRDLTATERFMDNLRTDKQEGSKELRLLSQKKRRGEKERVRRNLLNETTIAEEDEDDMDDAENALMDIDDGTQVAKKFKKAKLTPEQLAELARKEKIETHKQVVVQRMKNKIQKKWNRSARVNDADRQIGSKLPKHLNTGKRGIGKTDRR